MPYQAPFWRFEKDVVVPGIYIVWFNEGHTIAKHFEFLSRKFDLTAYTSNRGYFADKDDQLVDAVRSDPGFSFIQEDTLVTDEEED